MRKGLFLVVLTMVILLIQLSGQALAGFQESRWQIIQDLSNEWQNDYAVAKSGWERSDLNDGTPRWMNEVQEKYIYEIIGTPVFKVTLLGEIGPTEQSGAELGRRITNLMLAVGIAKGKLSEVSVQLFSVTVPNPGKAYYVISGRIRMELTYLDLMNMFLVVLTKD